MPRRPLGACSLLAVDPGTTTGLVVVSIDPRWLKGQGPASWDGMAAAMRSKVAYQIGREPRHFDIDTGRSTLLDDPDEWLLPILAEQPLIDPEDGGALTNAQFYSVLSGEPSEVPRGDLNFVDAGEVVQVRQVAGLLDNYPSAALVIEDFQLRTSSKDREALSADRLRLAIMAEEILHGGGRVPFLQTPSDAKTTVTDDRLRRAGLYFPGMDHARDAGRHAALFFREARKYEALRAQAWPRHFAEGWEE